MEKSSKEWNHNVTPKAGKVSKKVEDMELPNEMFGRNKTKEAKRHNYCEKCKRYYRRGSYVDKLWHRDFCDKK